MKIVFLGAGVFGLPSLGALRASRHEILHVISQPDRPAGRGGKLTPTPVTQWALDHALSVTRTEDVNAPAMLEQLRALAPEYLVVIAFGQKLSDALLNVAPRGGINLHSSLLPKYRGAAPINWAVINGDAEAGVCVIEVASVMDGGDILAESRTPVGDSETAGELHDRLAALGAPLLPGVLDAMEAGTLSRQKQDAALRTKAPKLSRDIAWVDFRRPAGEVSARIRGLSPWPGVHCHISVFPDREIAATILKCRAKSGAEHAASECGTVLADRTIACGSGALEVITIQPSGKKPMDLAAFANGYGFRAGTRVRSAVEPPAN